MTIRILLVDDHPVVRQGLKTLLEGRSGWEVIGEASDGAEAVEKAKDLNPDVMVLDVTMPRMNGLEACRLLRRLSPQQTACLQTIHSRHGHVQNHYIGIQVFRFFHSLCAVGCFPNDFPSRAPLQESLQPLPYDWVIIDQQYANCHAVLFL